MRILIIEDEIALGKVLKDRLEAEAYAVDVEDDGNRGLYRAKTNDYDAIVLDDILPSKHGFEICRELRGSGKTTPIILMSAESPIEKKVRVLDGGADDYLAKPFAFEEMSARLRALLRRPRDLRHGEIRVDDLVLDEATSCAVRGGNAIHLTTKEFALLQYLMKNTGRIISHAMILDHVWGGSVDEFSSMVETHIYNLRRKVDKRGMKKLIHTVSGRGYIIGDRS
jgi:two-component system copper resistance phosphate regulon response regulator CusR